MVSGWIIAAKAAQPPKLGPTLPVVPGDQSIQLTEFTSVGEGGICRRFGSQRFRRTID
jgi:hypothetical protein